MSQQGTRSRKRSVFPRSGMVSYKGAVSFLVPQAQQQLKACFLNEKEHQADHGRPSDSSVGPRQAKGGRQGRARAASGDDMNTRLARHFRLVRNEIRFTLFLGE